MEWWVVLLIGIACVIGGAVAGWLCGRLDAAQAKGREPFAGAYGVG